LGKPIKSENDFEKTLADLLVDNCYKNYKLFDVPLGILLASAFDLLVAAQYYSYIPHKGWQYCPTSEPRLFFSYTNCCPRDVINEKFFFHPSNKPESGKIGAATSSLLLYFYQAIFSHLGREEIILKGSEPIDAIFVNKKTRKILFAEIKASPLLTPPLSVNSEVLTEEDEGKIIPRDHCSVDNTNLYKRPIQIFIPKKINNVWKEQYFELGVKNDLNDSYWGYRNFINLLKENPEFFREYFNFWFSALQAYSPKATKSIFWLTNACGSPTPTPDNWPTRRRGQGLESISDSKTSVGMDRTDDIKKGIYQVLKLGAEGKPTSRIWNYKVAIISNIHAARHFNEYLSSLKDIIWTLDTTGKARKVSDLPQDQALFNLFDGIIALTTTLSRDEWIESTFSFDKK
jgi:hypothetical protein